MEQGQVPAFLGKSSAKPPAPPGGTCSPSPRRRASARIARRAGPPP